MPSAVCIQNSGILSPGSSATGTATYKITDADINTSLVVNLASAIGSVNDQPINSPQNIVIVRYKQPTNDKDNNGGYDNGDTVGPVAPVPMISGPIIAMNLMHMTVSLMGMIVNQIHILVDLQQQKYKI